MVVILSLSMNLLDCLQDLFPGRAQLHPQVAQVTLHAVVRAEAVAGIYHDLHSALDRIADEQQAISVGHGQTEEILRERGGCRALRRGNPLARAIPASGAL